MTAHDCTMVPSYDEDSGLWGVDSVYGIIYDAEFTEWQARLLADTEHVDFEDFLAKLPQIGCLAEWERQDKIAESAIKIADSREKVTDS